MAHKTIVGGTQYNIKKGKALVGGTEYSVKKGKTLVGGTAYEVGFAEMVTVTVNMCNPAYSGGRECASVTVLDKYYAYNYGIRQGTVEVPVGTVITCFAKPYDEMARIYLNGTQVAGGKGRDGYTYYHTVTTNVTIKTNDDGYYDPVYMYITET